MNMRNIFIIYYASMINQSLVPCTINTYANELIVLFQFRIIIDNQSIYQYLNHDYIKKFDCDSVLIVLTNNKYCAQQMAVLLQVPLALLTVTTTKKFDCHGRLATFELLCLEDALLTRY